MTLSIAEIKRHRVSMQAAVFLAAGFLTCPGFAASDNPSEKSLIKGTTSHVTPPPVSKGGTSQTGGGVTLTPGTHKRTTLHKVISKKAATEKPIPIVFGATRDTRDTWSKKLGPL